MKYLLGTLAALVLAAVVAGAVCYRLGGDPSLHAAAVKGDALGWLRADFHLTDAQFVAIRQLHESYAGTCEEHCRLILEATKARDAITAAQGTDAAAAVAAERKLQDLRLTCETAIARHVRQVAGLMSSADGGRYLALVLPKIAHFDHTGAPDLQLGHSR
jgi:hypothetical protein